MNLDLDYCDLNAVLRCNAVGFHHLIPCLHITQTVNMFEMKGEEEEEER